jgi:hypothetical protein
MKCQRPLVTGAFALFSCNYPAIPSLKLGAERFTAEERIRPLLCVELASGAVDFWNLTRIPYRAPPVAVILVRDGFACVYGSVPPLALPVFFTSVPFTGLATCGFEPAAFDGSADVGAIGAEFFVESFVICFPLA